MKKASYVLGIIGGCLAVISALLCLALGLFLLLGSQAFFSELFSFINEVAIHNVPFNFIDGNFVGVISGVFVLFTAVISLAAGVLGLIGAVSVNKNNVKAGVLMIVGAGLCLITPVIGFFPMALLLLGGIFALVKEKPEQDGQVQ